METAKKSSDKSKHKGKKNKNNSASNIYSEPNGWKPLLLIVPLRLGLTEINPVYTEGLKVSYILLTNIQKK